MKVGDRVIVVVTMFDTPNFIHSGRWGLVISTRDHVMPDDKTAFVVRLDDPPTEICYYPEHLALNDHRPMSAPDMSLDEIEEAENIMEGLNGLRV
jgi:hypothetical protein